MSYGIVRSHYTEPAKQEAYFQGETLVGVCYGNDFVKLMQLSYGGTWQSEPM